MVFAVSLYLAAWQFLVGPQRTVFLTAVLIAIPLYGYPAKPGTPRALEMINDGYVLRNLHEAAAELQEAIEAAAADDFGAFMARITFTYRKLNRAWNSRNLSGEEILSESDDQQEARCRFPSDLAEMISD